MQTTKMAVIERWTLIPVTAILKTKTSYFLPSMFFNKYEALPWLSASAGAYTTTAI